MALRDVGYGEILRLAYEANLIRFVKGPRRATSGTIDGKLIGQVQTPSPRARELDPAPSLKRVPPAPAKRADERMEADEMEEVAVFTEKAVQRGVVKGTFEEAAAGLLFLPTALELELALAGAGAAAAETGGALVAAEAAAGVAVSSAALAVAGILVVGIIAIAVADELVLDHAISNALRDALAGATGSTFRPTLGPAPQATVGQVDQPQTQPQPGPGPGPIASTGQTWPIPDRCAVTREPHLGKNDLANNCADAVPGNLTGHGARVMGESYDAYQEEARTLWEIKAHHYSSYSDFVKKMDLEEILRQLPAKKAVADMCGFDFVVGVIDEALAEILRKRGYEVRFVPC